MGGFQGICRLIIFLAVLYYDVAMKLYETLARDISQSILDGILHPGDRLPSVRQTCASRSVSPSTVFQAYYALEAQGLIEARERSGYFVAVRAGALPPEPEPAVLADQESLPVDVSERVFDMLATSMRRDVVPLGSAFPSPLLFPMARLARMMSASVQNLDPWATVDDLGPHILAELATVQMHAIQTSGNCIRNTTSDHFAGLAPDELVNPLSWCEIIRQWSALHPEFAYLPRKFKIAVSGALRDRAAIGVHDIGLQAIEAGGQIGFRVWVGGGLGRTPMVGKLINPFLPWPDLITYLVAILRVYNLHGRRDNKYKARIKILVNDLSPAEFSRQVDEQWQSIRGGEMTLSEADVAGIAARFAWPDYALPPHGADAEAEAAAALDAGRRASHPRYARWLRSNVHPHRAAGYAAVTVSLKATGVPPGDISADQMDAVADLADAHGHGELRISHEQNLILADVREGGLFALWRELEVLKLATPNVGLLTNIISCPGGDFCALANAASIPVAAAIQQRFEELDYLYEIGEIDLNLSGCINACGHHHIGHIGILGVDKAGAEWYQITIGGRQNGAAGPAAAPQTGGAAIGRIIGPSVARSQVPEVVQRLITAYLGLRDSDAERFIDVVDRLGLEPFKLAVYGRPFEPA